MEAIGGIKIFRMDDCEWWAARSANEAIAGHYEEYQIEPDEAQEITDEEAATLIYTEEMGNPNSVTKPFKQKLSEMVAADVTFPVMFASTEY